MAFFFIAFGFMFVGRKLGWALSRAVLYSAPIAVSILLCVLWGAAIAATIRGLINLLNPGFVLRWIMGYALGLYVAIPNFGLLDESTIPHHAQGRHLLISLLPSLVYIALSLAITFLRPYLQI
jgi:hypothetical protein